MNTRIVEFENWEIDDLFDKIKELEEKFKDITADPWTTLSYDTEVGWRFDWQYMGNTVWEDDLETCLKEAIKLGKAIIE